VRDLLRRALPVAVLTFACLYTFRLEVPETHTYPAGDINRLSADNQNGAITVAASADTLITVSVRKHAYGRNRADAEKAIANVVYSDVIVGDELRTKVDMPSGPRPYGADFTIALPASTNLNLSTTNGAITVTNAVGGIDANTTNGRIGLVGTEGTARLSTTNGALEVSVHRGGVDASTTNGPIDCDVAELAPTEAIALATTNGDVTLLLPADASATIEATNTNATIAIFDFSAVVYEVQTEHHIRARIGSGASSVTLTTTNASITVRARS
jgi:hypothetical protein